MQRKAITLGVDIGGTNTKIGVIDDLGNVLAHSSFPTNAKENFNEFINRFEFEIDVLRTKINQPANLLGVGIGAPNANFYTGRMEYPVNFNWGEMVPIVDAIQNLLNVPTVITNDANAAAVGEMRFGAAKNMKNFVLITLGTGLGSGIVVDGKLVHGRHGLAGEMGHIAVRPDGRKCNCGNRGCLETYASATGIKRTVFKLMADMNVASPLRDITFQNMTAKMITEAALAGDELASNAFIYTGEILGTKLADTVSYLNPEAIILSGGLTKAGDLLMKPTKEYMEKYMFPVFRGKIKLMTSTLSGANTAVLGTGALAWDFIEQKENSHAMSLMH
ncbi:MAG: ROK family protein [Saprospiraceae bacterium]